MLTNTTVITRRSVPPDSGLVAGHIVFAVMAGFVNSTMGLAVGAAFSGEGIYGSRFISPIGLLVLLSMMFYIHYQLAVRSYSLITQLPDRVARWSGASGENLGEEHDFKESHGNITAGVVSQSRGFGESRMRRATIPTDPGSKGTQIAEKVADTNTAQNASSAANTERPK